MGIAVGQGRRCRWVMRLRLIPVGVTQEREKKSKSKALQ